MALDLSKYTVHIDIFEHKPINLPLQLIKCNYTDIVADWRIWLVGWWHSKGNHFSCNSLHIYYSTELTTVFFSNGQRKQLIRCWLSNQWDIVSIAVEHKAIKQHTLFSLILTIIWHGGWGHAGECLKMASETAWYSWSSALNRQTSETIAESECVFVALLFDWWGEAKGYGVRHACSSIC